jgi:hypothetical protein
MVRGDTNHGVGEKYRWFVETRTWASEKISLFRETRTRASEKVSLVRGGPKPGRRGKVSLFCETRTMTPTNQPIN